MKQEPLVDTVSVSRVRERMGFDDFHTEEGGRLVLRARRLAGPAVAEGIAHEAMSVAGRRWREVSDVQRPDLRVGRRCMHRAVSQYRPRMGELRSVTRLAARNAEPAPERCGRTESFWRALVALPHRQAPAAALHFVYEMPINEIAETLECTPDTVKQHLARARRSHAESIGPHEVET